MRRKLAFTVAALVVLGGAVIGLVLARGSAGEKRDDPALPPATAEVMRTTLQETKTVAGTLGFGDPVPVGPAGPGTLTWIAPAGSTVERGEPLFKVDERPVVALYGSLPLYRTLRDGAEGADVAQLEQNLADLGYTGFTVDDAYTAATAAAVRTWQADLGLPGTGVIDVGQAVITPAEARIAGHTARVGDPVDGGSAVLTYTGTSRLVTVELEVADRALVVEGRKVTVTVPGMPVVQGTISEIGTVVTTQGSTPNEDAATDATTLATADARIEVIVTMADQAALSAVDAAPVDVDFVSQERPDVLAVPVAALLALPEGGFGVEVVDGDTTRIVPVETGMFAAGEVEVSGDGIAEGLMVGVPSD
jgi:membrane fusion protein, multidrug efflux system